MKYHILNGDALRERFPTSLPGEIIVCRECLVDGPVNAEDLQTLMKIRASFVEEVYGSWRGEYEAKVASEFGQIGKLPEGSKVYLWFEDDLFCQVNFWFVCHLLNKKGCVLYLIRPTRENVSGPEILRYGFAALSLVELQQVFESRTLLSQANVSMFANLWKKYQQQNWEALRQLALRNKESFPFLMPVVEAQLARIPQNDQPGRPEASLLAILAEQKTDQFGPVFREFSRRESIYGFGDLQVKRLFDKLIQ